MSDDSIWSEGYLKVPRKLLTKHPLGAELREYSQLEAYLDLYSLATWQDTVRTTQNGQYVLRRGEVVAAGREMAKRWHWTHKRARGFLEKLQKWALIREQRKAQDGNVYLIVNYDDDPIKGTQVGTPEGTQVGTDLGNDGARGRAQEEAPIHVKQLITKHEAGGVAAVKAATPTLPWVADVEKIWADSVGIVTPVAVERDLAAAVNHLGAERVVQAAKAYVTLNEEKNPAFVTPKNLAAQIMHWDAMADPAPVSPYLPSGEMNPEFFAAIGQKMPGEDFVRKPSKPKRREAPREERIDFSALMRAEDERQERRAAAESLRASEVDLDLPFLTPAQRLQFTSEKAMQDLVDAEIAEIVEIAEESDNGPF